MTKVQVFCVLKIDRFPSRFHEVRYDVYHICRSYLHKDTFSISFKVSISVTLGTVYLSVRKCWSMVHCSDACSHVFRWVLCTFPCRGWFCWTRARFLFYCIQMWRPSIEYLHYVHVRATAGNTDTIPVIRFNFYVDFLRWCSRQYTPRGWFQMESIYLLHGFSVIAPQWNILLTVGGLGLLVKETSPSLGHSSCFWKIFWCNYL